jgi:hypothetical protein
VVGEGSPAAGPGPGNRYFCGGRLTYVSGPILVVGPDVFDLDRDSDGIGCE